MSCFFSSLRFAGFGWGNQRPDKGSPAHIKGWDHENPAEDFEIYNNIMDRGSNWLIHCGYSDAASEPKIYDNIFIQYSDGLFGRYMVNPTRVVGYNNEMLADERLMDNTFYFISDESVPSCIGDKGTLSLKINGMPAYRDGEYIELHGTKITDAEEITALTEFFNAAHSATAIFTGFGGEYSEETVEYNDVNYRSFKSAATKDVLSEIAQTYFSQDIAKSMVEKMIDSDHPLFIERNDALYRYDEYNVQYSYTDAEVKVLECYKNYDGIVSILVETAVDGVKAKTIYKCQKDDDGNYKFTSAFVLPVEIALRALNG